RNGESEVRREWQKARAAVASLGVMFAVKPGLYDLATDDVVICRCEEVTAGTVREAVRGGATGLNSLKTWTRLGMGRCQGRICGSIAAHIVARESGQPV
ncbi:MAG TPA: FAD/NAD(P)-binding oxidoreductase, partial [Chloroflexi bacterium]|nr:FAD/NAD(P)-binding oxidoreductase [Chloroflexota bacterium]